MPRRKKRSVQDRIALAERELRDLREQARLEELEAAIAQGRVVAGKQGEFKAGLREIRLLKKTIRVAERHGNENLVRLIEEIQTKITDSMGDLIEEGQSPNS